MRRPVAVVDAVVLCVPLFLFSAAAICAQEIHVNSYYGQNDANRKVPGFPAESLDGPRAEIWTHACPRQPYHIGVLFPHLKDSYWETADYGIVTHARRLGVRITLYTAGAYVNFGNQRAQMKRLVEVDKVDGIVLASVDYSKMSPFVDEVSRSGIPVVALINDVQAPAIKAESMVSFFQMGYQAGRFVVEHSQQKDIKVAFFPGPRESGWAPDTHDGFRAAIAELKGPNQKITMLEPLYGDTRQDVQQMRLDVLNKKVNHGVDYIVGNAVAAVEAVGYLGKHADIHPTAEIVATYITPTVYEQIRKGSVLAAPSDQTIVQCKIALDMVVRILNGEVAGRDFAFRASPLIPLITTDNIAQFAYEDLFGERDFKPVVDDFPQ